MNDSKPKYHDFLIDTPNPRALDSLLQSSFASALIEISPAVYMQVDGHYVVRCFGDPNYLKFALESQGYAKIIGDYLPKDAPR